MSHVGKNFLRLSLFGTMIHLNEGNRPSTTFKIFRHEIGQRPPFEFSNSQDTDFQLSSFLERLLFNSIQFYNLSLPNRRNLIDQKPRNDDHTGEDVYPG